MTYKKVEKTTSKIGVTELPLILIAPDPNQPRKNIDQEALSELAESIKKHGVLQPIMVQPDADGYKIVFGERRFRAAELAGLSTIPAVISKELTPDETLEIQVLENLQRKDINPMEESDAFHRLLTKKIATAKQLASKLGVSVKYVYDRLALQSCILEVKEKIRAGVFTIGIGKKFARLALNDQRELFEEAENSEHEIDLEWYIKNQFSKNLNKAPFDTEDEGLNPGAGSCTTCQKRSGCNKLLFDDIVEESICFDPSCYEAKAEAQVDKVVKDLEAAGATVVRLTKDWRSDDENLLSRNDWHHLEIAEEDNETPVARYGVVAVAFSPNEVGKVIRLKAEEDEDKDDEDTFDSTDAGTVLNKPKRVTVTDYQHRETLQKRLAKALWESYTTVNAKDALRFFVEGEIKSRNDEEAQHLASLAGIVVKDEEGNVIEGPDEYQIAEASKDLPIELLYKVAQYLMHIDDLQIDNIKDLEKANEINGLDATAVIEAYKEETGWTPISI